MTISRAVALLFVGLVVSPLHAQSGPPAVVDSKATLRLNGVAIGFPCAEAEKVLKPYLQQRGLVYDSPLFADPLAGSQSIDCRRSSVTFRTSDRSEAIEVSLTKDGRVWQVVRRQTWPLGQAPTPKAFLNVLSERYGKPHLLEGHLQEIEAGVRLLPDGTVPTFEAIWSEGTSKRPQVKQDRTDEMAAFKPIYEFCARQPASIDSPAACIKQRSAHIRKQHAEAKALVKGVALRADKYGFNRPQRQEELLVLTLHDTTLAKQEDSQAKEIWLRALQDDADQETKKAKEQLPGL